MLASESLAIGEMLRAAMVERVGCEKIADHFRAFETICSATQDRQDAVIELLDGEPLDLMLVIGGYDSSNTMQLARICGTRVPTYHVVDANCLVDTQTIRHLPVGASQESIALEWLPAKRSVLIGLTAGASTPDAALGDLVRRLQALAEGPSSHHGA
jgi:4-hydroxy-3-methylbut-2-en-1-yl diphosphate reductase